MARKSSKNVIETDARVAEAIEEWKMVTEIRGEMAQAAYDAQDAETKKVLNMIRDRLRLGASGYVTVRINPPHGGTVPVKIEQQYLDFNLMYVATEILKDLALFDIRVANYSFPDVLCSNCGAEIQKTDKPRKKKRRAA